MTSWVQGLIDSWGALGVAVLMFLENLFPPNPSELVLPLAGYRASQGELSIVMTLIAGTIGSVLGVTIWYYAGRWLGMDRLKDFSRKHGRWLTLTPQEIDHAGDWFERHGGKAVLLGRLVPAIRTLISIPAGVCGMSLTRFLILTTIGTAIWSTVLIMAGYWLGSSFSEIQTYVSVAGNVIIAVALLYYLYRVLTFRRHVARPGEDRARER